jgi:hypothetical protein
MTQNLPLEGIRELKLEIERISAPIDIETIKKAVGYCEGRGGGDRRASTIPFGGHMDFFSLRGAHA